jgi:hypothetical protein
MHIQCQQRPALPLPLGVVTGLDATGDVKPYAPDVEAVTLPPARAAIGARAG